MLDSLLLINLEVLFLGMLKVSMNTFFYITFGFTCFIFRVSVLVIKKFNTLDLKDLLNEDSCSK
jgi:hypothetical protein